MLDFITGFEIATMSFKQTSIKQHTHAYIRCGIRM